MKKNFLKMTALSLLVMACAEDDNTVETPPPPGGGEPISVVINEVEYLGNRVELFNNGDADADLSDFWLCLGPDQYSQIGDVTVGVGEYLTVEFNMPEADGGLGLYSSDQFTDSNAIVDFVQWGAAGAARENVAVDAGLWTAGEFVPVMGNENYSIVFDGEGNGASNWAETTTVTIGAENVLTMPVEPTRSIVFNEVQYGNRNLIEIYNNGEVATDISSYWLCLGPGQYQQLSSATVVSGDADLAPGEFFVVSYDELGDEQGGLGLYSTDQFTNAEAIMDFVQWGASGSARENVAVEAGIWTDGEFVPTVNLTASIAYDGEGDAAADWAAEDVPTFGLSNDTEVASTTFNITITNAANFYNAHAFAERTNFVTGESAGPGPLNDADFQYQIQFQAVPGTKFTPVTMMGNSNDWFLAPEDFAGIPLWDENGDVVTGNIADQLILFDLGTEADNIPDAFPSAGPDVGDADPDTLARIVDRQGRDGATYITAELEYEASADGLSAGTFTFTIRPVANMLPNPANPPSSDNGFVATPGIVVLHELPNPVFTLGEVDRGLGLERIAEDGMPDELLGYFTELADPSNPNSYLRLASTRTVFSPGLVYAFNGERDPLVLQGEVNPAGNGLEELAEDGRNDISVDYLQGLGFPVAASDQTMPVGPGESLTFSIDVPQNQEYRFGFATMFVDTNDWFIAYNNEGYPLFDENGTPVSGFGASEKSYLYDAGTEIDQITGFGADQAPRQAGPNTGDADPNTTVRRVPNLTDVQFGKGTYNTPAGVVYVEDPRGGYNVIRIEITPQ